MTSEEAREAQEEERAAQEAQKEMVLVPLDEATESLRRALAEATRCCYAPMLQELAEAISWADSVRNMLMAGHGWLEDGMWDLREDEG